MCMRLMRLVRTTVNLIIYPRGYLHRKSDSRLHFITYLIYILPLHSWFLNAMAIVTGGGSPYRCCVHDSEINISLRGNFYRETASL